jgi:hypothetical protein
VLPEIGPPGDTRTGADWASDAHGGLPPPQRSRRASEASAKAPSRILHGQAPNACQPTNRGSSIGRRTVPGLSGSAITAISSLMPPPMGLPQVLARSIPTSTVCQGDTESRDDLFKDLPAYEKYHSR